MAQFTASLYDGQSNFSSVKVPIIFDVVNDQVHFWPDKEDEETIMTQVDSVSCISGPDEANIKRIYPDLIGKKPMNQMESRKYIHVRVAPYAIADFIRALHNNGDHEIGVSKEDNELTVSIPEQKYIYSGHEECTCGHPPKEPEKQ